MKEKKPGKILQITIIAVIGVCVGVAGFLYYALYGADQFPPGVSISEYSVGGLNRVEAEAAVDDLLQESLQVPLVFSHEQYEYRTTLGEVVVLQNPADVVEKVFSEERSRNLWSKLKSLAGSEQINYPIRLTYESGLEEQLASQWNAALGAEPKNAALDIDARQGLIIIPEINGLQVDIAATFAQLPEQVEDFSPLAAKIVLAEQMPMVTAEDLEIMGELSTFTTWYKMAEVNRSHNLTKAAFYVNGTAIAPGQEFSFNKIVGPRTGETGYRDAPVIVGNKLEPGLGGGICQVSSTLYNAALLAGLEIVERHNHNLAVAYVPLGLDATVAYGSIDFRFKNNTNYPIYIHSAAGGGKLTINIYGHLEYKKNIQTKSVVDEVIPFQYIEEVDPLLAAGETRVEHKGFPGYRVRSFRYILDGAGQVATTEMLASDRYKAFDEIKFIARLEPEPVLPPGQPGDDNPPPEEITPTTPEKPVGETGGQSGPVDVIL